MDMSELVQRQEEIAQGTASPLAIPKYAGYTICNLRGGIGKTSLAFNLSFLTNDLLVVDTCPQGNLSYFFNDSYYQTGSTTVYDMLLPYFMPNLAKAGRVAQKIGATNQFFSRKNSFFLPSSDMLYVLPTQIANAIVQARTIPAAQQQQMLDGMLYALKSEISREQQTSGTNKFLIDTSPFFSGATHLAWHASDALIIPVRTDQQSINSLNLLINILTNSSSEFRKNMPSDQHTPQIQMIVLTHCGWSTSPGARNEPNQQTKLFLEKVRDIVDRNIVHFTTNDPDNHIVLLDDFLGSGRISSALSKPISLLTPGETISVNRVRAEVNQSVEKIKKQLDFINKSIWPEHI